MTQEENNNQKNNLTDGSAVANAMAGKPTVASAMAGKEEKILEFWKENKIFEKSLEKNRGKKYFIFYEGPPGANGVPMLHHFEARAFKDVIPRYKTMQGFFVDRRAGWDCHGLPVELQAEKELGFTSKKDIENFGIAKYNQYCKNAVLRYTHEWEIFSDRMGYWVDNKRAYFTMDNSFIESSWHIVNEAYKKDLFVKDYKILPWCTRCGTGLSSHELGQPGVYQDVKDLSLYVKFKLEKGQKNNYFDTEKNNVYILAWTTTPWTLPGNIALALGKDISYALIKIKGEDDLYIVAKKRRLDVFVDMPIEMVVEEIKGEELFSLSYEPLFPYMADTIGEDQKEKLANAFKTYEADFVTIEDGTGVVHTAVMYGQDDFELGNKIGLPKHHLVNAEGKFISGTGFLEGRFVKETDENGKPTLAVDILKYLTEKKLFFRKENYEHSYPHCWRCKTPLIYYARDSWYFKMSSLRKELVDINNEINWEPEHIKEGRFGDWLKEIKDWAVSRERYWGTPLPVWIADDGEKFVVDSVKTLKEFVQKSGNTYFVARHGEAESNLEGKVSVQVENNDHLTELGKQQAKDLALKLKEENIDFIFYSDFARTKETASIIKESLGIKEDHFIPEKRVRELYPGSDFVGKYWKDYAEKRGDQNRYLYKEGDGENFKEVKTRVSSFLYELEEKYKNKKILIVTHELPMKMLLASGDVMDEKQTLEFLKNVSFIQNCEMQKIDFAKLPHNEDFELDLHRPYIDEIFLEKDGKIYKRTKEVMDVWFDSGAMPLAQDHYPFENKEFIDGVGYPADFISEAIDQTRGWFYTLVAVSALLRRSAPFKNVICLGHLLDKNGQKMSKSKGNVINPWEQMDKFGADSVRLWMYSVTQPGDSKNYDEQVVNEIQNKIFNLFYNVFNFYELYKDEDLEKENFDLNPKNVLDKWILSRLGELQVLVTESLDNYKIFEPARALRDFVSDLSTWYLRRSRERIKYGEKEALQTLYFVMKNFVKILAPFAPFSAEDLWLNLKNDQPTKDKEKDEESVHLSSWPEVLKVDSDILSKMEKVRSLVSLALDKRQRANVKVRQPLASLKVPKIDLEEEFLEIIKEEVNVKEVEMSKKLKDEVSLDLEITPELKKEGIYREFLRGMQDLRKKNDLLPSHIISIEIEVSLEGREILESFKEDFVDKAGIEKFDFIPNTGAEIDANGIIFKVNII